MNLASRSIWRFVRPDENRREQFFRQIAKSSFEILSFNEFFWSRADSVKWKMSLQIFLSNHQVKSLPVKDTVCKWHGMGLGQWVAISNLYDFRSKDLPKSEQPSVIKDTN